MGSFKGRNMTKRKLCPLFWCAFLIFSGIVVTSSHASEEIDCNEFFKNFFRIRNINSSDLKGLIPKAGDKDFKISLDRLVGSKFKFNPLLPDTYTPIFQPAHSYKITFTYGDVPQKLYLTIAATSQGHQNLDELRVMESVLKKLPSVALQKVSGITIFPSQSDWPTGILGSTIAILYSIHIPPPTILKRQDSLLLQVFQHELGHIMAFFRYGLFIREIPDQRWLKAIEADGNDISPRSQCCSEEDFAEAMRVYLATEGGLQDPYQRQIFHHRFKILDEILKVDTRQLDKLVLEQNTGGIL